MTIDESMQVVSDARNEAADEDSDETLCDRLNGEFYQRAEESFRKPRFADCIVQACEDDEALSIPEDLQNAFDELVEYVSSDK